MLLLLLVVVVVVAAVVVVVVVVIVYTSCYECCTITLLTYSLLAAHLGARWECIYIYIYTHT